MLQIQLMGALHFVHIQRDTQAGCIGHPHLPIDNLQRLFGQSLAILPYPVRIDRRDFAGRSGGHLREHRQ